MQSLTSLFAHAVRHAELRGARRLLLGQHGAAGHVHGRRQLLGVRRARLGARQLFLMFGVAEDHDSNPIKIGLGKFKARGAKFVSINPVRTGYSAIADEWIGIRPGTDGLFVLALVHELLRLGRVDLDYLARSDRRRVAGRRRSRHRRRRPLRARRRRAAHLGVDAGHAAARAGRHRRRPRLGGAPTLPDGRQARRCSQLLAERYRDPRLCARSRGRALRHRRRDASARIAAEIGHVAFERPIIARPALDRHARAGATQASSAGRWRCTPCAASRPTPTASRPAARCTCCSS